MTYKQMLYRVIPVIFFGVIFMWVGQLAQLLQSERDLQSHTLAQWAGEDPARQSLANNFKAVCLGIGTVPDITLFETSERITLTQCAKLNNFEEPLAVINKVSHILNNAAWPLSVTIKEQ